MASIADTPFTFIGLDVHKDSISAGVLEPGAEQPTHDKICHDEPSIRRLLGRFDPATLKGLLRGGSHRLRPGAAGSLDGHRLPGDRTLADPHRSG